MKLASDGCHAWGRGHPLFQSTRFHISCKELFTALGVHWLGFDYIGCSLAGFWLVQIGLSLTLRVSALARGQSGLGFDYIGCSLAGFSLHWVFTGSVLTALGVHWLGFYCIGCSLAGFWLHWVFTGWVFTALGVHWLGFDYIGCSMTVFYCSGCSLAGFLMYWEFTSKVTITYVVSFIRFTISILNMSVRIFIFTCSPPFYISYVMTFLTYMNLLFSITNYP